MVRLCWYFQVWNDFKEVLMCSCRHDFFFFLAVSNCTLVLNQCKSALSPSFLNRILSNVGEPCRSDENHFYLDFRK